MNFSFYKPKTQMHFEEWCRRIFQKELLLEDLQIFGRSGQKQDGIDLFGRSHSGEFVGIQCKLRNLPPSLLKEADIEADIAAARNFTPQLTRFIIATTAERDTKIQKYVAQVSAEHPNLPVTVYAWQDIEDILNANLPLAFELYPEFFPHAALRVPGIRTTASVEVTVEAAVVGGHEEINQAVDFLKQGAPGTAIERLEKLRRERWNELTARERYRLFVNLGLSYHAKGEDASAAPLLLQAEVLQPADEEAAAFASLGHFVAREYERAYEKAERLCRANPYLPVAQAVRISSAPEELSYEEVKSSVPGSVRKNADVARALYVRAEREGDLEEAEAVLRAVEGDAPIPLVAFHLGTVILHREMDVSHMTGAGRVASDKARVIEAKELLTSAIPNLVESVPEYPTALYNRAQAHLLLGDWQSAYLDFKSAHKAAPQDSDFAVAYAAGALERGEASAAVKILETTFERDPQLKTRLLLVLALVV